MAKQIKIRKEIDNHKQVIFSPTKLKAMVENEVKHDLGEALYPLTEAKEFIDEHTGNRVYEYVLYVDDNPDTFVEPIQYDPFEYELKEQVKRLKFSLVTVGLVGSAGWLCYALF